MDNERDEDGNPICPVCKRSIAPGEAVARKDGFIVHVACLRAGAGRAAAAP